VTAKNASEALITVLGRQAFKQAASLVVGAASLMNLRIVLQYIFQRSLAAHPLLNLAVELWRPTVWLADHSTAVASALSSALSDEGCAIHRVLVLLQD